MQGSLVSWWEVPVDGSYLVRKHQKLQQVGINVAPLKLPSMPLASWKPINVSALLHALVAMSPTEQFPHASSTDD